MCGRQCKELHMELLSCYLAELTLLDYGCVRFLPSVVASAALFLARFMIEAAHHPWVRNLYFFVVVVCTQSWCPI